MNEKHLKWCKSHDWGQNAQLVNGRIVNLDDVSIDVSKPISDPSRVIHTKVAFCSFKALREWAGY